GVVIILRLHEESDVLVEQINRYGKQDEGTELANEGAEDLRTFGIGAQILSDLGVKKMRVLSAPKKMHALSGFDLEVVEYVHN
ncbi:MAG: bifunctional 3,4-dihydroxy-2-butanone-4-phosphate synthase/GTP cyclohydrolase II, partial [Gammaproteobacteria bacterium]|nr:bifunctional 3,4-dihydroxy-2-butanone-4-phosphate synthase/GTP cyclohydrolase II [Gammaproteobacteria bacterium]